MAKLTYESAGLTHGRGLNARLRYLNDHAASRANWKKTFYRLLMRSEIVAISWPEIGDSRRSQRHRRYLARVASIITANPHIPWLGWSDYDNGSNRQLRGAQC